MPQITDPQKVVAAGRIGPFPNIFVARANPTVPGAKAKFDVRLIIDPATPEGKKAMTDIRNAMKVAGTAKFPNKWPHPKLFDEDGGVLDIDRVCFVPGEKLRDKDGKVRPEYKGKWVLKASSLENKPPFVVDSDQRTNLSAKDGKPYGGCKGKVAFRVYATDVGGPGIFAGLDGVVFKGHDEPLGGGGPARAEDYLDEETSDETEDDL